MARRVSVPSADDLFRPTTSEKPAVRAVPDAPAEEQSTKRPPARRSSGRVRHDEKMTVYITSEELLAIEHARLELRSKHGKAVDRGRIVREAVAMVLADFDKHGEDSALVRRLDEE